MQKRKIPAITYDLRAPRSCVHCGSPACCVHIGSPAPEPHGWHCGAAYVMRADTQERFAEELRAAIGEED